VIKTEKNLPQLWKKVRWRLWSLSGFEISG